MTHGNCCIIHPSWSIGGVVIGVLWSWGSGLVPWREALLIPLSEEWLTRGPRSSEGLKGPTSESSKRRTRCVRTLPSGTEVVIYHHLGLSSLDRSFFN